MDRMKAADYREAQGSAAEGKQRVNKKRNMASADIDHYQYVEKRQRSCKRRQELLLLLILLAAGACIIYWNYLNGNFRFLFHNSNNDTANQYFPSIMSTVQKLREGDLSFWDATMGYGLDITNSASWVFDLFNIPVYLAGIAGGTGAALWAVLWMQILKAFLVGIFVWLLLGELGFQGIPAVAGAYASAFCGYMMGWGEHYFFASGTVLFVALIWRIERCLNRKKGYWILAVMVGICLAFSLYISIMIAMGCLVYVLFRLVSLAGREGKRAALREFGRMILAVICGGLLSAVISLPAFWQLTQVTERLDHYGGTGAMIRESFALWLAPSRMQEAFIRLVSNNLYGTQDFYQGNGLYTEMIQLCFSCFWIVFLAIYFTENIFYGKKKGQTIILLAGFVFLLALPVTTLVFDLFENRSTRYTFVLIPFAAYVIAWTMTKIRKMHIPSLAAGWIMAGFVILFIRRYHVKLDQHGLDLYVHLIYAAEFLMMLILSAMNESVRRMAARIFHFKGRESQGGISTGSASFGNHQRKWYGILSLAALALITASTVADAFYSLNYETPWTASEAAAADGAKSATEELLAKIPENGQDFFRVEKMYEDVSVWNDSLLQNYSGVSYYNTTYNKYIVRFVRELWPDTMYLKKLGTNYVTYRNDGLNMRMANLLGVRYILTDRETEVNLPGFEKIAETADGHAVYRNESDTGFGTLYKEAVSESQMQDLDTEARQELLEHAVILSDEDLGHAGILPDVDMKTDGVRNGDGDAASADDADADAASAHDVDGDAASADEAVGKIGEFRESGENVEGSKSGQAIGNDKNVLISENDENGQYYSSLDDEWVSGDSESDVVDENNQEDYKEELYEKEPYEDRRELPKEMRDNACIEADQKSAAVRSQVQVAKGASDGEYSATVQSEGNEILLLPIAFDSGWKAYIDGKQSKAYCADFGFMGIVVPKGEHTVRVSYHTPMMSAGIALTACGVVALLIYAILFRRRKNKSCTGNK